MVMTKFPLIDKIKHLCHGELVGSCSVIKYFFSLPCNYFLAHLQDTGTRLLPIRGLAFLDGVHISLKTCRCTIIILLTLSYTVWTPGDHIPCVHSRQVSTESYNLCWHTVSSFFRVLSICLHICLRPHSFSSESVVTLVFRQLKPLLWLVSQKNTSRQKK